MKRFRSILLTFLAVCVLALSCAWWTSGLIADRQARRMLGHSRESFVQGVENSLDGVLWYAAELAAFMLGNSPEPRSVAAMQEIADDLWVDELTVVGTNGIAVASNYKEFVGFDWHSTPETAAYLKMLEPGSAVHKLMQKFRPCVIRHEHYRKYGGVVFTNRLGFVQVGYSMDRLVQTLARSDAEAFSRWTFGRHGRFGAFDADCDGMPDSVNANTVSDNPLGRVDEVLNEEGRWLRLTFPFAGRVFYAEVPDREFGDQRKTAFLITAGVILLLIAAFSVLLVRLRRSSLKLELMHAEAERRAASDMRLAHMIQMSTLPHAADFSPDSLAYGFDALMVPARDVGGDLYDFFVLADGRVAFVIGDVSGKGVPAAMFMLVAKNAIRQALNGQGDPAVAMEAANEALCAENEAGMFVTMFLGILNPATGEVAYVNAGHNRPYVVRVGGAVERLDRRGGRMLGLFPHIPFRSGALALDRGDRIFLYTDGVTEAQDTNGRLYGEPRLRGILATRPSDACAAVRADVAAHVAGAPVSDDLAILVLDWWGDPDCIERRFPATAESVGEAFAFLRESCRIGNRRQLMRLLQVADELVSNVVLHSGAKTFALAVSNGRNRCRVVLSDDGVEYNPLSHRDPDLHAPIEDRPEGGLGILLAKKCADFIGWRREKGCNLLTVVQSELP